MRGSIRLAAALAATPLVCANVGATTLELALVIDGSGSISASDWQLQIGAYQNVFQGNFYSTYVVPSDFDNVAVAAYVFSGGFEFNVDIGGTVTTYPVSVFSFLDWTLIDSDADAFAFGAQFAGLPQPGGTTATAEALSVATNGGLVSCPFATECFPVAPNNQPPFQLTAAGLLTNAYSGERLVIDISTDGVPTEPNGNGQPNATDRALAIAAADAARAAGITVNAIGVGDQLDAPFLEALVGVNPAATPRGFFLQAASFSEFQGALQDKIGQEVVPLPPTPLMFLTGMALAGASIRRR